MAYVQKNNPFKKTSDDEKEYLSYDEKMRIAGVDPYEEGRYRLTGADDRSIVNPRTYDAIKKLQDTTGYGNIIKSELMSAEYGSDYEKYRKKFKPEQETNITDYDKAVRGIIDRTNKMDVDQFNSIVDTLSDFGGKFKGKNEMQKFATLLNADLSGVKRVAGELGITKNQIMDLVKVPKNASAGDKLKVKAIRAYLRTQL
jgi:hypothetical protein